MKNGNAFEKRLKRQVIGKIREYFIAVSPGFESVCMDELAALPIDLTDASVADGGILFRGSLTDCYYANLYLRSANRILMRIGHFKASNFRSLEQNISEIPWELYLYADSEPDIRVTVKRSRLYHSDAVASRIKTGIDKRIRSTGVFSAVRRSDDPPDAHLQRELQMKHQRIFVRAEEDQFTISSDTSGELLFKRGFRHLAARAPIRETLAASILHMAGYAYPSALMDPMCGSGTFSLEAVMTAARIPAGWFRDFAFMGCPSFRSKQWAHIRKEAEKNIILPQTPSIFASDRDSKCAELLKQTIDKLRLTNAVSVSCRDFFGFSPSDITGQKGLVVINPPYGLRIGTITDSGTLLKQICSHLKKEYTGWKFALIIPDIGNLRKIPFPFTAHAFIHGGQKRFLAYGKI